MKKILIFPVVLLFIVVISGCDKKTNGEKAIDVGKSEKAEKQDNKSPITDSESSQLSADNKDNVKEFDITAKQWSFDPSVIEVKKGDTVRLRIKSVDVPHGFAIPHTYTTNKRLDPGETVEYEFVADKIGEFPFFCSVGCGKGHFNMTGKIIVTE